MTTITKNNKKLLSALKRYGTPMYWYDQSILQDTLIKLKEVMPAQVDIFYSIKANPSLAICVEMNGMGAGAEVCSYYEMITAIKSGFSPKRIIFVGPAKSDREILKCLELGIYAIICGSISEFKRISLLAASSNTTARVALRINPSHISKAAQLQMGGKASQFGIDEEIIFNYKEYFLEMENIRLIGIQIYHGTRILDAERIVENTEYILNLADTIQKKWNIQFEMVDIGGGLGIPYFENELELNLVVLKQGMQKVMQPYLEKYPATKMIVESGRYLVARAGMFLSQVVDIKLSKGVFFAVTNGGMNCHMAAAGIESLIKRNFCIDVMRSHKAPKSEKYKYNITGPLCTPNDLLAKQVELPKLNIGDFVVVKNSGAYGPTASPVMFLSHGFPAEVLLKNNTVYLIRDRFSEDEFFNKQYFLN